MQLSEETLYVCAHTRLRVLVANENKCLLNFLPVEIFSSTYHIVLCALCVQGLLIFPLAFFFFWCVRGRTFDVFYFSSSR